MASKKKAPKQGKAPIPVKEPRIGKNKRAPVIEKYRPEFEKHLAWHLERNQRRDNRPTLIFSSVGIPQDLPRGDRDKHESCPVCGYRPYAPNITARPRLTLTEKDADKFLQELGFADEFVKNYLEEFRNERIEAKGKRKTAWGIPNFGDFISFHGAHLMYKFPWLTVTAAALIVEDLLKEKDYIPGRGTIKAHLREFALTFKEGDLDHDLDLDHDPECTCGNSASLKRQLLQKLQKIQRLDCKLQRLKTIGKTFVGISARALPKQYRVKMNNERQIFDAIRAIEKPMEATENPPD